MVKAHALWRCVALPLLLLQLLAGCLIVCLRAVLVFMELCSRCVCVHGVYVDGVMGATVVLYVVFNKTTVTPITPPENDITFSKNTLRFPKPLSSHSEPLKATLRFP